MTTVGTYSTAVEEIVHKMNMQNIPSKHSDIRHMFAGGPGHMITLKCKEADNKVSVRVVPFTKIQRCDTPDAEPTLVFAKLLKEGDYIKLKHNGEEVIKQLCNIELSQNECILTFSTS